MNLFQPAILSLIAACAPEVPPGDERLLERAEQGFLTAQSAEAGDREEVALGIAKQFNEWAKTVERASGVQIIIGDWADGHTHTSVATETGSPSDASTKLTLYSRIAEERGWEISSEIRSPLGVEWVGDRLHFRLRLGSQELESESSKQIASLEDTVTTGQN